ncbi:MAG TPA: PQQ-binding-like beta-propeller repeat protein [Anaerolineales bacterium]|nr:PQQ-binding-like beta-propeller repeat protein [Anaerolineales bacterium]
MMRIKYYTPQILLLLVLLGGGFFLAQSTYASAEHLSTTGQGGHDTQTGTSPEGRGQFVYLPLARNGSGSSGSDTWPMAGANPERTSWTSTEVRGTLEVAWFKPFDAYILPRVQIIATNGLLYISTSNGLYALNATTGDQVWVYPTEMPLGNAPTIYQGIAFVGGFDRKIHAINALTGEGLWTYEAGAGFDTNPLIVNGVLYAGNRDGFFYAIQATGPNAGQLVWKYDTGAPIHFSAAFKDGLVYFASNSSRVYALQALSGTVVWQTGVLPGAGFHSWWPVIYDDYVIVAGSQNYRFSSDLGPGSLLSNERMEIFPNYEQDPRGTLVGPLSASPGLWAVGTPTIDASKPTSTSNGQTQAITEYFEEKPWRRTYFVFNRLTGEEYTTDFDNDGQPEYAPFLWIGLKGAGNRYPPVIGGDNVLYQANSYMSDPQIAGGHLTGWTPGSKYVSVISSDWGAVDEPYAYSAGGNVIYWNLCCDRQVGGIDVSLPNTVFADRYNSGVRPPTGGFDTKREWFFFNYDIDQKIPGYNEKYFGSPIDTYASFGNENGIYGYHGDQNAPIPYNNMVFLHRSNAVIALVPESDGPEALPMAQIVPAPDQTTPLPVEEIQERLDAEITKILDAGHLLPGYLSSGIFDLRARFDCGDDLVDYFHSPADTLYTLIAALPYLSPGMQEQVREYLQTEFDAYPPYTYNHVGWQTGTPRDVFLFPPEVDAVRANYPPKNANSNFEGWQFSPYAFYAMAKYAEEFGNAEEILAASNNLLETPPVNSVLIEMPHVVNAYIAGYEGYLDLQSMAGVTPSVIVQTDLAALKLLRWTEFTVDLPSLFFTDATKFYCRELSVSRNFMYLTPELGDYLHTNALPQVQTALNEYETLAPYWFVTGLESAFGEGVITPLYDYHAIFQARALILQEPYETLVNYLDVPAFAVGDLYYIQNLITLLSLSSE